MRGGQQSITGHGDAAPAHARTDIKHDIAAAERASDSSAEESSRRNTRPGGRRHLDKRTCVRVCETAHALP